MGMRLDFDIAEALALAVHAPSSHNAQPWHCDVRMDPSGSRQVVVTLDRQRVLSALPYHAVEMALSLGAFVHILETSLLARGRVVASRVDGDRVVVDVGEGEDSAEPEVWDNVARAVLERRTVRGPLSGVIGSAAIADAVASSARVSNVHLTMADSEPLKRAVALLLRRAVPRDFRHAEAWRETFSFINWGLQDGSATSGMRASDVFGAGPWTLRALRVALDPRLAPLTARSSWTTRAATAAQRSAEESPGILVVSRQGLGDHRHQVDAGRGVCAAWLALTRHGIALHPTSVLVQYPDLRAELAEAAELAVGQVPLFVARAGVPTSPGRPSVRRKVSDVAAWN